MLFFVGFLSEINLHPVRRLGSTILGNYQLVFKMKPTDGISTSISRLQLAFRYPTASTPSFTVSNIVSNTTNFPGLNIQRLPDFVEGGYTYVKFIHNTAIIASAIYSPTAEYNIFTLKLNGVGTIPQLEMVSDFFSPSQNYIFEVANGLGLPLDPGGDPLLSSELYGPGFTVILNKHLLPLTSLILPIKFADFTATKKANDGILNWSAENESNLTATYEIERSFNGVDFKKFELVAPKNNGLSSNDYTLTDFNLSSLKSSGVIYYRIKQIDVDGKFVYSVIRTLVLEPSKSLISVSPNPVKDITSVRFNLEKEELISMLLIDANGKQIQQLQVQGIKGLNNKTISMANLSSGTYQLIVKTNAEIKTISIVKVN